MDFSVIIPLYNKARFIKRALDSVLRQTTGDYEIIVVDDGSTDEGPEAASSYKDRRIKLIRQRNQGVSAARNRGIEEAEANFIAFLDADDLWRPNYLEIIATLIEQCPGAGAYATAYDTIMPDGKVVRPKYHSIPPPPWQGLLSSYFRAALGHPPVWTSATTVPKHIFHEVGFFPVGVAIGEDLDMWGRIALRYPIAFSTANGASYFQDDALRHECRKLYFSTVPEAVFARTAAEAIRRGDTRSVDLKELYEYLTKIQLALGYDCLVYDQNPITARKILLKTSPESLRFKWRKYRILIQTYLPGLFAKSTYKK